MQYQCDMDFVKIFLLINVACFVGLVDARPKPLDEIEQIQDSPNTEAEDITDVRTSKPVTIGDEPVKISIPLLGEETVAKTETKSSSEVGTSSSINVPVGESASLLGVGGIANNLNALSGPPYSPENYGAQYQDGYGQFGDDSVLGLGGQFGPQSGFGPQGVYNGYAPEGGFGPQSRFRYNQPGAFGQGFGSQTSRLGIGSLGNFLSQFLVQFRTELLRSLGTLGN